MILLVRHWNYMKSLAKGACFVRPEDVDTVNDLIESKFVECRFVGERNVKRVHVELTDLGHEELQIHMTEKRLEELGQPLNGFQRMRRALEITRAQGQAIQFNTQPKLRGGK